MPHTSATNPDTGRSGEPVIAIVVPCYNETQALPISVPELLARIDEMASLGIADSGSFLLLVDDGSTDGTWDMIKSMSAADPRVRGLALAHNRGHQYALLAGLMEARTMCDAAVSIDADLQDDPTAIVTMVQLFRSGKEIVYGVRSSRASDTAFKRNSAHAFYSFQKAMGLETVYDHADYRLMSARALDLLAEYGESNIFLRGIVPQIGLETAVVEYARNPRVAGISKYPLRKMLALSVDGITSFSAAPMRWIFYLGLAIFLLTFLVGIYVLVSHFFGRHTMPGWASLMISVWVLGSLILMSIGMVGEYVGKIFREVKHRPRYAVRERTWQ